MGRRAKVVREQLSRRIRRTITGEEDRRVRDFVRQILDEPPVVRLRDKLSFFLGVAGCLVVESVALLAPQQFGTCFILCNLPLLIMRAYLYKRINMHYFLIGRSLRTRARAQQTGDRSRGTATRQIRCASATLSHSCVCARARVRSDLPIKK